MKIKNGWCEDSFDALCNFHRYPLKDAEQLIESKNESLYVVETINLTPAEGESKMVHHNKYFTHGLGSAVALATCIEIGSKDCTEELIAIPTATEEENEEHHEVYELKESLKKQDLAEEFAKSHPDY